MQGKARGGCVVLRPGSADTTSSYHSLASGNGAEGLEFRWVYISFEKKVK